MTTKLVRTLPVRSWWSRLVACSEPGSPALRAVLECTLPSPELVEKLAAPPVPWSSLHLLFVSIHRGGGLSMLAPTREWSRLPWPSVESTVAVRIASWHGTPTAPGAQPPRPVFCTRQWAPTGMSADGTVRMCPVHKLVSHVCLLSSRGLIQEMSGDTSSCLGEWISFAFLLRMAKFLVLPFSSLNRGQVACGRPGTYPCGGPVIFLCPFDYRKRVLKATKGVSGCWEACPLPHEALLFCLAGLLKQNPSLLRMRRKEPFRYGRAAQI